jgi:hypothetical protein
MLAAGLGAPHRRISALAEIAAGVAAAGTFGDTDSHGESVVPNARAEGGD